MQKTVYGCPKCVGEKNAIKYGKSKNGTQRYLCKECRSTFLESYSYKACSKDTNKNITLLLKEGVGILSTSRLLGISKNTVMSRILKIASGITKPTIPLKRRYELDEMCSFIQRKANKTWIAYAIDKRTRDVVDFKVGKRTNKTLKSVLKTLFLSEPKKIHTDGLRNYKYLIPEELHSTKWRSTNGIENKNLSLRINLKRLQRRTICFAKTQTMLAACLKIFFWG